MDDHEEDDDEVDDLNETMFKEDNKIS